MQSYSTILGVIELRLEKVSYATTQKRYRIGSSTITLIMNRFGPSNGRNSILSSGKSSPLGKAYA